MKNYIHHIVVTVSNAKSSREWYKKALGWEITEEGRDYVYLVPDSKKYPGGKFMLVLGEPRDNVPLGNNFDRNKIGLDHFAFNVDTIEELKDVEKRLKEVGIEMENNGITDDDFGGTAIFCIDPDGMKVEFHLYEE